MKRFITLLISCVVALTCAITVYAADGAVTYDGNAQQFVFEPGSKYSLTDMFADFKGVMPGDSLTQKITVKNTADNDVNVKIYVRSLGAHEDSIDFLSKLNLKVKKSDDNEMAYMFDAAANETAQLTDWVCLGTLYSGGEVNLDVILNVPVELDNEFQNKIGYLDWEFKVEEFPTEPDDPQPPPSDPDVEDPDDPQAPQTGDNSRMVLWVTLMAGSLIVLIILLVWHKKDKENEDNDAKH